MRRLRAVKRKAGRKASLPSRNANRTGAEDRITTGAEDISSTRGDGKEGVLRERIKSMANPIPKTHASSAKEAAEAYFVYAPKLGIIAVVSSKAHTARELLAATARRITTERS